ncbi:nuclear transport factor 2 family protein [Arthrobacter sp. MDT1-65]
MPTTDPESLNRIVRRLHNDMCEAMMGQDSHQLGELLAGDYSLTHMTGYLQPKTEWLDDISTGQMRYHDIVTVELDIDTPADDQNGAPVLTARTLTDATIWGGRGTWRLQLRSWFEPSGDDWVFSRTVASTW